MSMPITGASILSWPVHPPSWRCSFLVFLLLVFFYILERNEKEKQILLAMQARPSRKVETGMRAVFESTGTVMVILNEDTSIGFANKEFFHLTAIPRRKSTKRGPGQNSYSGTILKK
ncbi:MAG: hypothetical protein M0C28_17305 [Candidatus Moduliflexus flocculans]|nr:hypothetical protein [Candidatus Moduliflexus flocculans]